MFKLSTTDTYKWPINFSRPVDGGRYENQTFTAVFRRLKESEVKELFKGRDQMSDVDIAASSIDRDLALKILAGFEDIMDGDTPLVSNQSNIETLLDVPTMSGVIIRTYFESLSPAKRKN